MNKVKVLSNSSFSKNEKNEKVVDKRMTDYFFVVKYSCLAERVEFYRRIYEIKNRTFSDLRVSCFIFMHTGTNFFLLN